MDKGPKTLQEALAINERQQAKQREWVEKNDAHLTPFIATLVANGGTFQLYAGSEYVWFKIEGSTKKQAEVLRAFVAEGWKVELDGHEYAALTKGSYENNDRQRHRIQLVCACELADDFAEFKKQEA